ncbi:MAG: glutamine--tRNA ligase [Flavobacteriales bacterium]|nr:glutamine--tRNA ligase [Flavobacteriales bacterium]
MIMSDRKSHFIEQIIEEDIKSGMSPKSLRFRFPPEPNGYLHVGHIKAICVNFNLGALHNAPVNLRFDDTNPEMEEIQFVDAIKNDISWLGFKWDKECYASDYFQQLFEWSILLIEKGLAYIDSQTSEQIANQKGTPTLPGINSPFRNRTIDENKRLFLKMKDGNYQEGEHVLRAKIDMTSPNMLMRDPIMFRIVKKPHLRTGNSWSIYPMYDWTHGQSDYIENISHSLCTLEFKPHRELYDWFLDALTPLKSIRPKQREFARLNLSYTVTSKRKLKKLIDQGHVKGWDDPRMPTISGLRKRGYTPESLKNFVKKAGVAKRENLIDVSLLEFCIRDHLNKVAPRVMAVVRPIKLTIKNYPQGKSETVIAENNPEDNMAGNREIPFSGELFIEKEDFRENANRKYFRLTLGKEVRLKNAYIIKGEKVIKSSDGTIEEIICSYDPLSKSGSGTEQSKRKVKGTLHWVTRQHSLPITINIYDRLFSVPEPDKNKEEDPALNINPNSLEVANGFIEPSVFNSPIGKHYQFQRLGYFILDSKNEKNQLVFNKTVGLRDSW